MKLVPVLLKHLDYQQSVGREVKARRCKVKAGLHGLLETGGSPTQLVVSPC